MDLLKTVIKPLSITLNEHYSPLGLMKTNGSDKKKTSEKGKQREGAVRRRACWEITSAGGNVGTGWYKEDVLVSQLEHPLLLNNHS